MGSAILELYFIKHWEGDNHNLGQSARVIPQVVLVQFMRWTAHAVLAAFECPDLAGAFGPAQNVVTVGT